MSNSKSNIASQESKHIAIKESNSNSDTCQTWVSQYHSLDSLLLSTSLDFSWFSIIVICCNYLLYNLGKFVYNLLVLIQSMTRLTVCGFQPNTNSVFSIPLDRSCVWPSGFCWYMALSCCGWNKYKSHSPERMWDPNGVLNSFRQNWSNACKGPLWIVMATCHVSPSQRFPSQGQLLFSFLFWLLKSQIQFLYHYWAEI